MKNHEDNFTHNEKPIELHFIDASLVTIANNLFPFQ